MRLRTHRHNRNRKRFLSILKIPLNERWSSCKCRSREFLATRLSHDPGDKGQVTSRKSHLSVCPFSFDLDTRAVQPLRGHGMGWYGQLCS